MEKITAKEMLDKINQMFPELKHIAKDKRGSVHAFQEKPYKIFYWHGEWAKPTNIIHIGLSDIESKKIEWGNDNWEECICSL